ncbi:MAG: NAD-dependent epimerase/dehydratase family protein [Rectinemataceae bacterium]
MKILVTGADGLLGSNIVRALLGAGHRVRAFVQPGRDASTLAGLDIELARGDLLDRSSLHQAAEGVDAIVHAAASTSVWPARSELVRRINIDGTKAVLDAAKIAQVRRFVHIGSAAAFGPGTLESPGDETRPYAGSRWKLDYIDSKASGQALVLDAARKGDVPALVLAPTFMLGPWDSGPSSGKMLLSVAADRVPGASPGGKCYVAVRDAARCVLRAMETGEIGESYIVGARNMNYAEAFTLISSVAASLGPKIGLAGCRARTYRPLPKAAVLAAGAAGSVYGALTGKAPQVSYAMARIACSCEYYSGARAARAFGIEWTPIESAVEEAFLWFAERGYLKHPRHP